MADNKFKHALEYAFNQEINEMPSRYELESRYSFSENFEIKMEKLIKEMKKKYFNLFGLSVSRYNVCFVLMALAALIVFILKYKNIVSYSDARFILAITELLLLAIFGINIKKGDYTMPQTLQTGFADYEKDESTADELEFPIPVPPENYEKTNEYRTTTNHTVEYTDTMGRVINYTRIDIHSGILPKIETSDKVTALKVGQWEAIWFIKDNLTNLVWADNRYRYQLTGSCSIENLIKMAESI